MPRRPVLFLTALVMLSVANGCACFAQAPIDGISFAHTFNEAAAPSNHHTQYFEMFGHRSIYHDGWRAVCPWPGPSFTEAAKKGRKFGSPIPNEVLLDVLRHKFGIKKNDRWCIQVILDV